MRRYLIRRLNQRRGPMANPSANKKEGETITSVRDSTPPQHLASDFIFNSRVFLLAGGSADTHQNKTPSVHGIHGGADPEAKYKK